MFDDEKFQVGFFTVKKLAMRDKKGKLGNRYGGEAAKTTALIDTKNGFFPLLK